MKKIVHKTYHLICFCLISSFSLGLIFGSIFIHSAQAANVTVSVFPPSITAVTGQNFSINVNITNVFDLYGWEFKLSWNATLLDAVSQVEGPFLKTGGSTYFTSKANATAGYMIIDCTLLGYIPGVSGSGILATMTFYVKEGGECTLDLYDVLLLNSFEQPIPCQTQDGYGYFTYPHDIAIINVNALPIIVLPGDIVNINVTAQNQGSFAEVFNVTINASSQIIGVQSVYLNNGSSTTIPFIWNTTGFGKGEYAVTASASVVQDEVDTADNTRSTDSPVTILDPSHDTAIIGVIPSKTIVGQGYSMIINVTAKNYGIFSETFNVTVYANTTIIQTQMVTLASGNRYSITFIWNTSGFAKGNYTISAYAWPVSGETDIADNNFTDGVVWVKWPYDVNGDNYCGVDDIVTVAEHFGAQPPDWNPIYDINNDNYVGVDDIVIIAEHFGQTNP